MQDDPETTDGQDREREYSPSSCIGGDYAPYLRAYAEGSAEALRHCPKPAVLHYGPKPSQRMLLMRPEPARCAAALPLLVFIHGGYWQELSAAQSLFAAPDCLAAGCAFVALDYTLAPSASVLEIAVECRQALRHLSGTAGDLGLDARRIVVAGSSAGAHLAACTALRDWSADPDLAPDLPAALVLVSGVYDLEPLIGTRINDALRLDPAQALLASPLRQSLAGLPLTAVCWGENETTAFKRQSRDFAQRLAAATSQQQPDCFEILGRNHFDVILDLVRPGSQLGETTLGLLSRAPGWSPRAAGLLSPE